MNNKPHTEESKRKISLAKIGRKLTEEHKRNIGLAGKGRKHSEETKLKMSLSQIGKKHTEEHKLKLSEANKGKKLGENNSNWKGGISCEPYCHVWSFKEFKEMIKERDDHKCSNPHCNHKTNKLCVHHINYIKKDCDINNLITLCVSCNSIANNNRSWHQSFYGAMNNRRNYRLKYETID